MSARELITEHLDLWTGAVTHKSSAGRGRNGKIELTGIKKLRELILELAVRGKLVDQDPNDEPASVLLERIAEEKTRLVKEGKIKKPKKLPENLDHAAPFEPPQGWQYAHLGILATQITDGVHHTPKYLEDGVPFISVKDIDGRTVSFDDCKYISEEQHLEINKRCNPEKGDILICRIGTLGRATIVDTPTPFSLFVSVGLIKYPQNRISPHYLHIALHSPHLTEQYEAIKAGGSHTNKLNLGDIPKLLIPVPPQAEQQRIVEKVDELMALCDRLEQQVGDQLEAHEVLVDTLLDALTRSTDAAEVADNWARITEHFDTLFTTEASIDKLKQTILQLAVMGRLVEQDPNDEPASVLLERIAQEKARLVKEGKIKKPKKLPSVEENEAPNFIPNKWEIARVGEFVNLISGQHLKGEEYTDSPEALAIPYLTGPAEFGESHPSPTRFTKIKRATAQPSDILITCKGSGVGSLNIAKTEIAISRQLMAIRPIGVNKEFVFLLMGSLRQAIREKIVGIAIPGISREDITYAVAALPPLGEQHRIVEKVDELMALCDQLKTRLSEAGETRTHLAEAVVEQAVS